MRDHDISIWQPLPTNKCHVGGLINTTQMTSVLAEATVYFGLWTLISTFYSRRGIIAGFYGIRVVLVLFIIVTPSYFFFKF